jgi:DNA-binding Lrp family transcriptional regulator
MTALDAIDRRIVAATESGLPLVPAPYAAVGEAIGVEEAEIIRRMGALIETGAVRRLGAIPNHYALGYKANGMSVWDVEDERVEEVGRRIGALDFVSHCYRRPRHPPLWRYNLFAMVHDVSREAVLAKVETIAASIGPAARAHDVLFSARILKKTGLRLGGA